MCCLCRNHQYRRTKEINSISNIFIISSDEVLQIIFYFFAGIRMISRTHGVWIYPHLLFFLKVRIRLYTLQMFGMEIQEIILVC